MVSGSLSFCISPTEDSERVSVAVARFFPERLSSQDDFTRLREAIFARKIIDTVRSRLLQNSHGDSTFLLLHRQALMTGKVSVCDEDSESPLGAIRLSIADSDITSFIDWLAPKTIDGVPVVK